MTPQYIGITGFTRREQVEDLLHIVEEVVPSSGRLMVGVLMDHASLGGNEGANPRCYPKREEVRRIFVPHRRLLNLVHYTSEAPQLDEQLKRMSDFTGPDCDGYQLNIPWPKVQDLFSYREYLAKKETLIVLQINKTMIAEFETDAQAFESHLREYAHLVDAFLIDASGGRGEPLDIERTRRLRAKLGQILNNLCPVNVAGGFGPDSVDVVKALYTEDEQRDDLELHVMRDGRLPLPLGIDAQFRLRTRSDELDPDACALYLRRLSPAVFV